MAVQQQLQSILVRLKAPEEWACNGHGSWFIFPKAGGGHYVDGKLSISLAPGDVLVLNSSDDGHLRAPKNRRLIFSCFSLRIEQLLPLFAHEEISPAQQVFDGFSRARHYAAATAQAVQCHRLLADVPPHFDLEHRSHLLRVVAAILAPELRVIRSEKHSGSVIKEQTLLNLQKLSATEILTLSIGELADKFHCSRRHLNRLFHQHFGLSAAALKMEMRMVKAVALLRNPHIKVINVAEDCGFHHLGLFNTCFKKRFGVNPGQWRKTFSEATTCAQPGAVPPGESNCRHRFDGLCPWIPVKSVDKLPSGNSAPAKLGAEPINGDPMSVRHKRNPK